MIKLKTKIIGHYGQTMTLPILGDVEISKDGTIETDNEHAVMLLTERTDDWEIVGGKPSTGDGDVDGDDIKKLSLEELIEVAKDAEYPEAEYKKFMKNQKLMAKYITTKNAEADLAKETGDGDEDKDKE